MLIKLILAYRASHSITSPIRDRSPYSSPAYTPLLSPPSGFSDVSNSPQRITPDSTHASVSDSILFQTADSDSYNLGQEVEIYADSLDGSASKCSSEQPEHYFPARKSIFQPQTIISVNRDDEYATALSELSDKDTLLTDTTIHAFMTILRNQFPRVCGLQNIIESYAAYKPHPRNSIQIHHDNSRTHWLVSCADRDGVVNVFDSTFDKTTEEVDIQLSQIYPQKHWFKYVRQELQQQVGPSDCGLFATAVCTALVLEVNPSQCVWDQSQMRSHLTKCLIQQDLSLFPTLKTGNLVQVRNRKSMCFRLYCLCDMPEFFSQYMTKCIDCKNWFHNPCVNLPDANQKCGKFEEVFKCPNCNPIVC